MSARAFFFFAKKKKKKHLVYLGYHSSNFAPPGKLLTKFDISNHFEQRGGGHKPQQ